MTGYFLGYTGRLIMDRLAEYPVPGNRCHSDKGNDDDVFGYTLIVEFVSKHAVCI